MNSLKYLIACLITIIAWKATAQHEELPNLIYLKDQIPEANSNAIKLSTRGFLYVAGQGNLCVFAQKERVALIPWSKITNGSQNAFNEDEVLCNLGDTMLIADKDGLGVVNGKDFKPDIIPRGKEYKISHIAAIDNKTALILSKKATTGHCQLEKYENGKIRPLPIKDCQLVGIAGENGVFGANKYSVFSMNGDGSRGKTIYDIAKGDSILNLFSIGQQKFAVSTPKKIIIFDDSESGDGQVLPIKIDSTWAKDIRSIKYLGNTLFVATLYNGLFIRKGNNWVPVKLTTPSGKDLKYILSLDVTPDGVLLIGTRGGGVLSYSPKRSSVFVPFFTEFDKMGEFHENSIRSIYNHNNIIYFGTDEGEIFTLNSKSNISKKWSELPATNNRIQVRSLSVKAENVYIGTGVSEGHLYIYKNKEYSKEVKFPVNGITSINSLLWSNDTLYIGTTKGLFFYKEGSKGSALTTSIREPVRSIVGANSQLFAVGNHGAIWSIDKGDAKPIGVKITDKDILHIAYSREEGLYYIFTRGDYVISARIENGTICFENYYRDVNGLVGTDGAKADVVYGGYVDAERTLWLSTDKGIFCKKKGEDFFYRFTPDILGLPDNPDGNTGAFAMLNDGTLLFGFRSGGVRIHTNLFNSYSIRSKVVVLEKKNDITQGNVVWDSGDTIRRYKNFSSIDLIPYDLENVFGGARPIYIHETNQNKLYTGSQLIATPESMINNNSFPLFSRLLGIDDKYTFGSKINVSVKFIDTQLRHSLGIIVLSALLGIISINMFQRKIDSQKHEKNILELYTKALNRHFYKNIQVNSIQFSGLEKEMKNLNLLKSIVDKSALSDTEKSKFFDEIKMQYAISESKYVHLLEMLRKQQEKEPNSKIYQDKSYLGYIDFLNNLIADKKKMKTSEKLISGFFGNFINDSQFETTIEKEIKFITSYMDLFKALNEKDYPLDKSFSCVSVVSGSIPKGFYEATIPRMLIQPLVENAITKGAYFAKQNNLNTYIVSVTLNCINERGKNYLCVSVENDGYWVGEMQESASYEPFTYSIINLLDLFKSIISRISFSGSKSKTEQSNKHSLDFVKEIIVKSNKGKIDFKIMGNNESESLNRPTVKVEFQIPIKIK